MGGVVSSIFGGGASKSPEPVEYKPAPARESEVEPVSRAARDTERKRLLAKSGGMSSTLLTSPLGGAANNNASGILGRLGN